MSNNNLKLSTTAQPSSREDFLSEQFLSYVFHELRTPLTVVHSYAQIALDKLPESAEFDRLRQIMRRMVEQSDETVAMLEELLEASRIPLGRLNIDPIEIELNELLTEVLDNLPDIVQAQVSYTVLSEAALIKIDPPRMQRSLETLILFGLGHQQAAELVPQISVVARVAQPEGKVKLELKMPNLVLTADEQQSLFDLYRPIRQTNPSLIKAGPLDIGLYLARAVAEAHFGSLAYQVELPGFVLELPLTNSAVAK